MTTKNDSESPSDYSYRCEFCDQTYSHELLTRVHISRSANGGHRNQNGFMPETEIEVLDENDQVVNRISKHPGDLDVSELSLEDFPSEYDETEKWILLVAAKNHDIANYRELENEVNEVLSEVGLDSPSYSTIRRKILNFYRPQEQNTKSNSDQSSPAQVKSLDDLTCKQQGIIISMLAHPDYSNTDIAKALGGGGVVKSYPTQVRNNKEEIITELRKARSDSHCLEEVIADELSKESIEELHVSDLLEDIEISLELIAEMKGIELDTHDSEDDVGDEIDEYHDAPIWLQDNVMASDPPNPLDDSADAGSDEKTSMNKKINEYSTETPDTEKTSSLESDGEASANTLEEETISNESEITDVNRLNVMLDLTTKAVEERFESTGVESGDKEWLTSLLAEIQSEVAAIQQSE